VSKKHKYCEVCNHAKATVIVHKHISERYPNLTIAVCESCRVKHYVDYTYTHYNPLGSEYVSFDRKKLKMFKAAYHQAKKGLKPLGRDVFTFEGNDYVLEYAKYMIQYLEGHLTK